MTTIVGLDVSLTSTGIATVATDGHRWTVDTRCVFSSGHRGDSLAERAHRIRNIGFDVANATDNADLVVIEGPAYSAGTAGVWERGWLWGHLVNRITRDNTPVLEVSPATRAKFATGKGNADKASVAMAVAKMWPDWEPTFPRHANDEADALCLASIGAFLTVPPHPPFAATNYRAEAIYKLFLPEEYAA